MPKNDTLDLDELRPITYYLKRDDQYPSNATLRRYLRAGRLPRRLVDRKYWFSINEVRAAQVPVRTLPEDEALIKWAKVQAASAGPMSASQIDIVVNAFRDSLKAEVSR